MHTCQIASNKECVLIAHCVLHKNSLIRSPIARFAGDNDLVTKLAREIMALALRVCIQHSASSRSIKLHEKLALAGHLMADTKLSMSP